jgi:arginase family enzyme
VGSVGNLTPSETRPRYGPADSSKSPRFTGPRTFMRLPHLETTEDVDVAICGIPTDDAVSYRSGARFGPEAIRSQSVMLRPYNPDLGIDVAESLSMVDFGDAPTVPGYHLETLEQIEGYLHPLHQAGVVPLCLGGDHSMLIAELRAAAKEHGPVALVHLDAHSDAWDKYYEARYFHGTVVRRAVEEGLISPEHSVQAGMRGTLYDAHDEQIGTDLGLDVIPWRELGKLDPSVYGERVANRVGDRPAFLRAPRRSPTWLPWPASPSSVLTVSRSRRPTTQVELRRCLLPMHVI